MALRMGQELEFHFYIITWQRPKSSPAKPSTTGPVVAPEMEYYLSPSGAPKTTPVGYNKLFVPEDITGMYNPDGSINYQGDWGLYAMPDGLRDIEEAVTPGATVLPPMMTSCVPEFITRAAEYADHQYWVLVRQILSLFEKNANDLYKPKLNSADGEAVGKTEWQSIDLLLRVYNDAVAEVSKLHPADSTTVRQKFRLKLSDEMKDATTRDGWKAMFHLGKPFTFNDYVDVQLNMEVDIRWLGRQVNVNRWVDMWCHMWVYELSSKLPKVLYMDPYVGDRAAQYDDQNGLLLKPPIVMQNIYLTQITGAIWRLAAYRVAQDFDLGTTLSEDQKAAIRGLLTYILAAGCITRKQVGVTGSAKNSWPLLGKTSPASIAAEIGQDGQIAAKLQELATTTQHVRTALLIRKDHLRNLAALGPGDPGGLPRGTPDRRIKELREYRNPAPYGNPVSDSPEEITEDYFANLWRQSLLPNQVLNAINRYGYTDQIPFNLYWAKDVRTGLPARAVGNKTAVVFESRVYNNLINIGFNPKVLGLMFGKSYTRLLRSVAPEEVDNVENALPDGLKDDLSVRQNFENGWH